MHLKQDKTYLIDELNKKIIKYKNECGCDFGAKSMTIAFLISLVISIHKFYLSAKEFLYFLPFILLYTFLGAILGKLFGKLIAYYNYKKTLNRLSKINDN